MLYSISKQVNICITNVLQKALYIMFFSYGRHFVVDNNSVTFVQEPNAIS